MDGETGRLVEATGSGMLGLLAWDADGRVFDCNDEFLRLSGFSRSEHDAGEVDWRRLTPAEYVAADERALAELARLGRCTPYEKEYVRRDGSRVVVAIGAVSSDGGRTGTAYVLDLGDRRKIDLALRDSQARLRAVIDTEPACVKQLDAACRLIDMNPAGLAMLGASDIEALRGRSVLELVPAEQHAAFVAWNARVCAGARVEHEFECCGTDGSRRTMHSHGAPLALPDGRTINLAVTRDVTEERQLTAQLALSDRMASVGTLAAGVAHEINNPLSAVVSNVGLALRQLEAGASSIDLDMLRDALAGALRIRDIVADLKLVSHSRTRPAGASALDVREVATSAVRLMANDLGQRSRVVTALGEVPPIDGDPARLGQVMVNLLGNAARAIDDGGGTDNEIQVATYTDDGGRAVVEVRDTGCGIAAADQRRVFDPFYTTRAVGEGSGLGLAICHRLVTGLGGTIEVVSAPGRGSTFRVILPPSSAAVRPEPAPTPEPTPGRARVLVIDDDPMVCTVLVRALDQHATQAVGSARAGLELIGRGARFDLILCDVMMPDVTGMDFYAELQRTAPELAARIVFVTGGVFSSRARRFLDDTGAPQLDKPFDLDELLALVGRYCAPIPAQRTA